MSLRAAIEFERWRLLDRAKFNRDFSRTLGELGHDEAVIAHVQEVVADRLQALLDNDKADNQFYLKENTMNTVKSLAGTGKEYCQFVVRVTGGAWGEKATVALVEKKSGGCGGYGEKVTALPGDFLPVIPPAGDYTLQGSVRGGGCGEGRYVHIQWATPNGANRNRGYGYSFNSKDARLIAALS